MSDATSFNNFLHGVAALSRFERGTASYEVNDEGDLVLVGTVTTVKMLVDEDLYAFHQRLRRDYGFQKGDQLEILNNGGKCDTVRLTLAPRLA